MVGEPVGIIVADDEYAAKYAAGLVQVTYEENPQYVLLSSLYNFGINVSPDSPVYSIDDALAAESFFPNVHTIRRGNVEQALQNEGLVLFFFFSLLS